MTWVRWGAGGLTIAVAWGLAYVAGMAAVADVDTPGVGWYLAWMTIASLAVGFVGGRAWRGSARVVAWAVAATGPVVMVVVWAVAALR